MRVEYVCGYGRSGSTTLGRLLAQKHGAVALGEVAHASPVVATGKAALCSCGLSLWDCPFWGEALRRMPHALGPRAEKLRSLVEGPVGLILPLVLLRRAAPYIGFTKLACSTPLATAMQVLVEVGGGALVDTSKTSYRTASRPLVLAAAGAEVGLHMPLRPWREVRDSYMAAHRRRGSPVRVGWASVRVLVGLGFSRISAQIVSWRLRTPLTRHPLGEIAREASGARDDAASNHMVAGNRLRVAALQTPKEWS